MANHEEGFTKLVWQRFATGLRAPSQIQLQDASIAVLQHSKTWTSLTDTNNDGVADLYMDLKSGPEIKSVPSPFQGMTWLPARKAAPFKGQHFGYAAGDKHISRMIKESDLQGDHHTKILLQDGFRYPIDEMLALADHSWIVAQTNRNDPTRTRLRANVQRLVWKQPLIAFEIENLTASADCFNLSVNEPLNPETAEAEWSFEIYTMPGKQPVKVKRSKVNPNNPKQVAIYLETPVQPKQFYQITCDTVWSTKRNPVRNASALFIWTPTQAGR